VFLLLWLVPVLAQAQDFGVDHFSVTIELHAEGYFEVVETYDVEFFSPKHGIYRDILTSYTIRASDGSEAKRQIRISDIEVPGHKFEASGNFSQRMEGNARIKIGDPDKTVVGPMHYEIRYRVDNAFLFEEDFTRFYWNLKPSDWVAPFKKITFRVILPEGVEADPDQVFLYAGPVGSTSPTGEFGMRVAGGTISGTSREGFGSNYGEAVTLLVNLPKGSIAQPGRLWLFWSGYGWVPILLLLAGGFYKVFLKYGKDDPSPMVVTYFPPDNMDPAMVGFLINDREDTSDLVSLLPYWGTRGLLEMEEVEGEGWFAKDDILIKKLADLPAEAPGYQKIVFDGLFHGGESEVRVSSLKNTFYLTMNMAKKELAGAAQKYYDPKARRVYWFTGGGIVLAMLVLLPTFFSFWGVVAVLCALVLGVALLILNRHMVKKNPLGIKIYSELKGFRAFIKTAEENRLRMLLKESPDYFETTMAYALAFGALKQWAQKFENLDVAPPTWYHTSGGFRSMHQFSRSFSSTMERTSTTLVSSPSSSSSGGGSSGGGMGGGGGGSW
jgi:uncharacterized membrane protein YgcG